MSEEEVFEQTYFEDLQTLHLWLEENPENIFHLYADLQKLLIEDGFTDPEEIKSLAITMMTFPYAGRSGLNEDEVMENYNKILILFQCGAFMFGKN